MNSELKKYLDTMVKEISNKTARENARLELENHLLDEIEALTATGLSEEESTKRVLAKATSPTKLGAKLNLAHRPFIFRYPLTFAFTSLSIAAFITVVAMSHYLVENFFLPQMKANYEPVFEEKFQKDLEIIAASTLLKKSTRTRNALTYIMKEVGLENTAFSKEHDEIEKLMVKWNAAEGRVGVNGPWKQKHLIERLMRHELFKKMDLSWVDGLLNYDHLEYFSMPENDPIFQNANGKSGLRRIYAISGYKIPDMGVLRKSIVLRTYQLIHEGRAEDGKKLLLHGFTLSQSAHSLIGSAMAANFLSTHEKMRKTFKLNWKEIPKKERLAFRRIGWGWASVMNRSLSDPDSFTKWKSFAKPEYGVCAGVTEAQGTTALYSDFFEEKAPMEIDLSEMVTKSKTLLAAMNRACGLAQFIKLQEADIEEKDSLFTKEYFASFAYGDSNMIAKIPLNPARIPYVRRMYGMFLMTVAVPGFHSIYLRKDDPEV